MTCRRFGWWRARRRAMTTGSAASFSGLFAAIPLPCARHPPYEYFPEAAQPSHRAPRPGPTEGSAPLCGVSVDQIVAQHYANDTQIPSLELGIDTPSLLGSCDINYSCTYTNTLSWSNPTTALPVTINPREVFELLFGD